MAEKIGEITRAKIMQLVKETLEKNGFDVLKVASGSFGIPAIEGEEETAVKIVFQVPKGARDGGGYDVFEEAQAYEFHCNEIETKKKKKAEEKAKKLSKAKKEGV